MAEISSGLLIFALSALAFGVVNTLKIMKLERDVDSILKLFGKK